MTELRCPSCHRPLLDEIELVAGDPSRRALWCEPCRLVVERHQAVHVPVPRERADLA